MTAPPYLSKWERAAVETALRRAGWIPETNGDRHRWICFADDPSHQRVMDLREVFPSPWTVPQTGECGCFRRTAVCPVHGEAS